jgi:hypothetical protein
MADIGIIEVSSPYVRVVHAQMQRRELLVVAALVLEIEVRFPSISS